MKTILSAALAASLVVSAGAASAAPYDGRGGQDRGGRFEQPRAPVKPAPKVVVKVAPKPVAKAPVQASRYERRAVKRYAAGRYQRPSGYQQRHWRHGERLPAAYRGKAYVVDAKRYGLQAAPRGYQYTRVDNDVVLTAIATGVIASVIIGMFQ